MSWLGELFSSNNSRVSTQFALSIFCTIMGFMAAVSVYGFYAIWLRQDIPPNLSLVTNVFIGQSVGGAIASILYKPKGGNNDGRQPGEPQASGAGPAAVNPE